MNHKLLFPVVILLLITACASPVYRLVPEDESEWIQGGQYVTHNNDNITATLRYVRHNRGMITFDFQLINESGERLRVDPSKYFYVAYLNHPDMGEANRIDSQFVIDPEAKILEIDKAINRRRAGRTAEIFLDATVEIANIASDISTNTYNSRGYAERAMERHFAAEQFDASMYSLETQRSAWSNLSLRRTDLGDEQELSGFLHIPHNTEANYIEIIIPIAETQTEFKFLYNQKRFSAYNDR